MDKQYLFCRVAHSPLRKEAADPSEMVSESLFGELFFLLSENENWLQIKSLEDDYVGYADCKHFWKISEITATYWKNARQRIFTPNWIESPRGKIQLPIGSFVSNLNRFEIEQHQYSYNETTRIDDWVLFAKQFLNTSYLWGGRTEYGIDCSGFSQQVMRFRKVELPRDASMQVQHGVEITFSDRKKGDVAYFQNKNGKVTHVGILIDEKQIIHASGFVKIDELHEYGICNIETQEISHCFHSIKRYL